MPLFWYSTNYNTIENLGLAMPLRRAGCPCFQHGGLAQLARALDLHSRGHRFDSDILHDSIGYFGFERVIVIQHSLLFRVRFSCLTRNTFIDILIRYKKYQPIFFYNKKERFIRANNNK